MKKTISFLAVVTALLLGLCLSTSAVSEKAGMEKLREQFESGDASLDYVCYSPVRHSKDKMKYPLVIWLHGNSSGDYPGHQIDNSNIALWSSDEYQSRFELTEGAFILAPRYPTSSILAVAWEGSTNPLKNTIDTFVQENIENIDTQRIYIGGYSMGGKMVLRMAATYPNYFAAIFPLSPVYAPSIPELNNLIDMPVWFFYCKNDDYVSLNNATVISNWQYLMSVSNCREKCRLSTFNIIYNSDYTVKTADGDYDIHNTWDAACHDMFMDDKKPQKDVVTKDGAGNVVTLEYPDGLIHWLSAQSRDATDTGAGRTVLSVLENLWQIMLNAFRDILLAIFG